MVDESMRPLWVHEDEPTQFKNFKNKLKNTAMISLFASYHTITFLYQYFLIMDSHFSREKKTHFKHYMNNLYIYM